jgi:hypothetical protein
MGLSKMENETVNDAKGGGAGHSEGEKAHSG